MIVDPPGAIIQSHKNVNALRTILRMNINMNGNLILIALDLDFRNTI